MGDLDAPSPHHLLMSAFARPPLPPLSVDVNPPSLVLAVYALPPLPHPFLGPPPPFGGQCQHLLDPLSTTVLAATY